MQENNSLAIIRDKLYLPGQALYFIQVPIPSSAPDRHTNHKRTCAGWMDGWMEGFWKSLAQRIIIAVKCVSFFLVLLYLFPDRGTIRILLVVNCKHVMHLYLGGDFSIN